MIRNVLIFLFLIFNVKIYVFSQENNNQQLQVILLNRDLAEVNVDTNVLTDYIKKNIDVLNKEFSQFPKNQKIAVYYTIKPTGNPLLQIVSNPEITTEKIQLIEKSLPKQSINTKIINYHFMIGLGISSAELEKDFSEFKNPIKQKTEEYVEATLSRKIELNRNYVINEVIPVLSAYHLLAEKEFKGVKNFGEQLSKINFSQKQNVEHLTSTNYNYWRAILEMEPGNQLIATSKIAMLISQDEYDLAMRSWKSLPCSQKKI